MARTKKGGKVPPRPPENGELIVPATEMDLVSSVFDGGADASALAPFIAGDLDEFCDFLLAQNSFEWAYAVEAAALLSSASTRPLAIVYVQRAMHLIAQVGTAFGEEPQEQLAQNVVAQLQALSDRDLRTAADSVKDLARRYQVGEATALLKRLALLSNAPTVLIADDHDLFRAGMRELVKNHFGATEIEEAQTFDELVAELVESGGSDLVLIDVSMPGIAGAESLAAIRDGFPNAKVAILSAREERADILAALGAGVHGYIPKSLSPTEMASAIRSIIDGEIFVPAMLGSAATAAPSTVALADVGDRLTQRQQEVLNELLKGQASMEIARTLDIAEGTVKIHLAAIYRALGVRTRAEALVKLK